MGNFFSSDNSQPFDKNVTSQENATISMMVNRDEYRSLARLLKITEQKIQDIEVNCMAKQLGSNEIVIQILQAWQSINGNAATKGILKDALISIGRRDIADTVYSNVPEDPQKMKMIYEGIQKRMENNQRERCKRIELPQLLFSNRNLPLEELYVNLELLKSVDDSEREPMELEELFNKIDGKDPVRILVEGGPGFGKTTLCYKLLHDFGIIGSHISSKFKLIFFFALRYFEKDYSIEEMLKRECEIIGVKGDEVMNCIKAYESETLLILDGFDEMNEESKRKLLPLLRKNEFPTAFVIVTSRRGMFEVEKKEGKLFGGFFEMTNENTSTIWSKKVLIKGVTTDKIEIFLKKFFKKNYQQLESKINSIIKGDMRKVFQCPLFLILLAVMLEEKTLEHVHSQTTLYKEFFNFIIKRHLIRKNELSDGVDIFNQSSQCDVIESLNQFGRLALEYLSENILLLEEKDILTFCSHNILHLGFLIKIPQLEGTKRENFYQPIHKSFLEFVAAFAMWNLCKDNEDQFKMEIERIGDRGLKPTNDSLFYVFLGGLMNSKAYVLFQSLTRYDLWFNIENICFTNILLEIKDVKSFFPSFQPLLDSFIPSHYEISGAKGLKDEYFQSDIYSLILKHSSDRQLFNVLSWNSDFSITLSHELKVEYFILCLIGKKFKICPGENKTFIKCKTFICQFNTSFDNKSWNDFVTFFNSVEADNIHFNVDSSVMHLLYNELINGKWKNKKINRLRCLLNEYADISSLSHLRTLVRRNKISEGIFLWISEDISGSSRTKQRFRTKLEDLFFVTIRPGTINEFIVINDDVGIVPVFDCDRLTNLHKRSLGIAGYVIVEGSYFQFIPAIFRLLNRLGIVNSNEQEEKATVEEIKIGVSTILFFNSGSTLIKYSQGMKQLDCTMVMLNRLVESEYLCFSELEELALRYVKPESVKILSSISKFTNLHVLRLYVDGIGTLRSDSKPVFIQLFSTLNLIICEFFEIQNLEIFSFCVEVLMDGLKKKVNAEVNSTIESNEEMTFQLQELVISFKIPEMKINDLISCNGIQWIRTMLRNKLLQQFSWIDYFDIIQRNQFDCLFPLNDKFKIFYELDGMNPNSSRQSKFDYRWFAFVNKFCIKFIE